jgi:hypothetical protein
MNPFPRSVLASIFRRSESFLRNPDILGRRALDKRLLKSYETLNHQAETYIEEVGLKTLLVSGRATEISPIYIDLYIIHQLLRTYKPKVVVELGIGFSTLTMAHALEMNGEGELYSVEANEYWLQNTKRKLPKDLAMRTNLIHSTVHCHMLNGQFCSLYDNLPNVSPNFIYVDAPHGSDVLGTVNGLTFNIAGGPRQPVAADPLLYESTAQKDSFFILVDGRARNAEFLRANLKGRYRYHQSTVLKQTYFERI